MNPTYADRKGVRKNLCNPAPTVLSGLFWANLPGQCSELQMVPWTSGRNLVLAVQKWPLCTLCMAGHGPFHARGGLVAKLGGGSRQSRQQGGRKNPQGVAKRCGPGLACCLTLGKQRLTLTGPVAHLGLALPARLAMPSACLADGKHNSPRQARQPEVTACTAEVFPMPSQGAWFMSEENWRQGIWESEGVA